MAKGTEYAHLLGVAAFVGGQLCVPMFDGDLMKMLDGKTARERFPLYDAWLKGWHDANLLSDEGMEL